ncbi:MAG: hypothetical protein AW08_03561 [Candidatus Accumulibacter adjunctus]|uniref:Uncharacterized protein n=1 Tax=Candidatus Accumulibacter adjunctus TaxID=1454001 RepID=A0A011PFK2_9PROT|nr:MAG: hypothetical protein AW08_03561 [Candidatus Accumulibacter adjunctus]
MRDRELVLAVILLALGKPALVSAFSLLLGLLPQSFNGARLPLVPLYDFPAPPL